MVIFGYNATAFRQYSYSLYARDLAVNTFILRGIWDKLSKCHQKIIMSQGANPHINLDNNEGDFAQEI